MLLNQAAAEALAPRPATYIVFDNSLPGFGCRVSPGGVRAWIFEYRPGGGRRSPTRRMTIGRINALPYYKARAAAAKLHHRTKLGEDPAAVRDEAREAPTVDEMIDRFLREEIEPKRKGTTVKLYRRYFKDYIRPALGRKRARDVTYSEVAKLHRAIGARGAQVTANRAISLLGTLYRWAVKAGEIPKDHGNPATDITRFRERARERYLTADEIGRLGDALVEAETTGIPWEVDEDKPTAKHVPKENRRHVFATSVTGALRLLILTGCRKTEILHAKWEHVDWERAQLVLPDSKTGGRRVPLSAAALAVLEALPRLGVYIVASDTAGTEREQPRHDLNRPWRAISKRAGLEALRIHDLRHSFASVGAGLGLGLPIVGKLLGHREPATTARYAHFDIDPLRRATDRIGAVIEGALKRKPGAAVVALKPQSKL